MGLRREIVDRVPTPAYPTLDEMRTGRRQFLKRLGQGALGVSSLGILKTGLP